MARPLRIQFPGATYHVIARGNARQAIFLDDGDRSHLLDLVAEISPRLAWRLLTYCLMDNYYHLLIQTEWPSLADGMREINGRYAQGFNRRHDRAGHVFQGRYHAVVVERQRQLLSVVRYIVHNPVRAGLCATPASWTWSSHRAVIGLAMPHAALATAAVLEHFGPDADRARRSYARFVRRATLEGPPVAHPLVAGRPAFRTAVLDGLSCPTKEVTRAQRAKRTIEEYGSESGSRDEAIRRAHASGTYSLAAIGRHFGLHYSTVSRICARARQRLAASGPPNPEIEASNPAQER